MNTTGRVGSVPAMPVERPAPASTTVIAPGPVAPRPGGADTIAVGAIPVRSAELLAWLHARLAEPGALLDLRTLRVQIPAAGAALRNEPTLRGELVRALTSEGWAEPRFETAADGTIVLRASRPASALAGTPPTYDGAAVVARLPSAHEAVSSSIADRVSSLPDPARPLIELSLSGPADRAIAVLLRSDPALRARVLADLADRGFPRATLDDLDLPALARITLRHPEREVGRSAPSPDRSVAPRTSAAVRDPALALSFEREARAAAPSRPSRSGLALPVPTAAPDATSLRLQLAALVAFGAGRGSSVPVPRWTWVPLGLLAAVALWRLLA